MNCSCGRWEFRDVSLTTGLAALERTCPRCRGKVLLCFRGPIHLATVALIGGRHSQWLSGALRTAGFLPEEVELLVTVARLMAAS